MADTTSDISTDKLGTDDEVEPRLLPIPVAATTKLPGGTMVATNASGYGISPSTSGAAAIWGRCEKVADNSSGNAGDVVANVRQGVFEFAQDASITLANVGQNAYAVDNQTVSASDSGGTRLYAGKIMPPKTGALASTDKVPVFLGAPNAYALNPELSAGTTAYKARAVITTLQAYGGSGTATLTQTTAAAGLSAADGVTLAVGDVVFIQGGTTNLTDPKDSGPWVVTTLGSASIKWVLTRPDWFANGSTIAVGAVVELGGEGTLWSGTSWKAFCAKGKVVGTDDPTFYVGRVSQKLTLTSSTVDLTNVGLKSNAKSAIIAQFQLAHGTTTSTIGYGVIAAPTAGYIGTATATIDALASGMGKNGTADASDIIVTVINW